MKKFIDLNIQRFGSTNKTTHYELSQYVGTDKPTYLGDYNGDMSKIDTAIYNVADAVSGVSGTIAVIQGNIGTLASLTTTTKTDLVSAINEVDSNSKSNATNIGTLANLETTNKTTLVNAINEVKEEADKENAIILWSNPDPTQNFGAQNITLSTSDYDVIELFYYASTNDTKSDSVKFIKGSGAVLRWWAASNSKFDEREINYVDDLTLSINQCSMFNVGFHNNICIPDLVVGYKTGLFE